MLVDLQIWHVSGSSSGSDLLHKLHMMPVFLAVLQTWQNSAINCCWVICFLASLLAMSLSIEVISSV